MAKGKKAVEANGNGTPAPLANGNGNASAPAKREIPSISIVAHASWLGKTTTTDKRLPDKSAKFSITVPVPETDEEMQSIYGVSLADVIEKGVTQLWYGARDVDNAIKEKYEAGIDPNSEEFINYVTDFAASQRFEVKERVSQAKETKELKSGVTAAGMSITEAIAVMKKLRENPELLDQLKG